MTGDYSRPKAARLALAAILLASLWFMPARSVRAQAPTANGPSDPVEVEAFLDGLLRAQMDDHHVPGAVVVVVREGAVLFAKGYGYADVEARTPVDPARTLFRPGSVSKLFTWTAVMQLVEQDRLDLNTDVNAYLDFQIPATYAEPITLKHLLTHTPGFEDKGDGLFKLAPDEAPALGAYLKANLPARVFPPGQIGAYSNYGTALAGYIVERVSGQPFAEYVEQHIFAPLGMTQATFRQPLPAALAPDMAGGYNYVDGGYVRGGFEYVTGYPAGSLSAAGLDLAQFMIAHLQDGQLGEARLLEAATARQMHSQLYTPDPRLSGMAYGFFENEINGRRVISHGGDTMLFHSGLFLLPDEGVGVFISTNSVGGSSVGAAVFRAFMDRYYPAAPQPAPAPAADFTARAAQYAGDYYLARSNFTTFEKFISLTTPVNVRVDEQGNLFVNMAGEVTQYAEVEPGLLQSRDHPDARLVLKEVDGQVYLHPSSPFVFIKAPGHRALGLHLLILFGGALLCLGTVLGWGISFGRGLMKREARPWPARLARLTAGLFGLAYLAFLVLLGVAFGDVDPAYGVPRIFFGAPAWFGLVAGLPNVVGLLGVGVAGFTVLAWWKGYWTLSGRVFYTGLALAGAAILWSLAYWNFLL